MGGAHRIVSRSAQAASRVARSGDRAARCARTRSGCGCRPRRLAELCSSTASAARPDFPQVGRCGLLGSGCAGATMTECKISAHGGASGLSLWPSPSAPAPRCSLRIAIGGQVIGDNEPLIIGSAMHFLGNLALVDAPRLGTVPTETVTAQSRSEWRTHTSATSLSTHCVWRLLDTAPVAQWALQWRVTFLYSKASREGNVQATTSWSSAAPRLPRRRRRDSLPFVTERSDTKQALHPACQPPRRHLAGLPNTQTAYSEATA